MEGTTLGALILELNLDDSGYNKSLEDAHQSAIAMGKAIEQSLRSANGRIPALVARVDDRGLTKLNQHLDLKERHIAKVNKNALITMRTDTSNLDALSGKLQAIDAQIRGLDNRSVNVRGSSQAQAGRSVELKSDTRALERSLGQMSDKLGDTVGKSVQKGIKQGSAKNPIEKAFSAVGSAPKNILRGFYEGVGATYARKTTEGFIKGIEGEIGSSIDRVSEKVGAKAGVAGKKIGDSLLKKAGIEQGLNGLTPAIDRVSHAMKEIIPVDLLKQRLGTLEQAIEKTLDGIIELDSKAASVGLRAAGQAAAGVARVPVEGVDARRDRKLSESAVMARQRAEAMKAPVLGDDVKSVSIVSGGFAGTRGESSKSVAERVKLMMGESAQVDYVNNVDTDTSVNVGKAPKWLAQIAGKFGRHNLIAGRNQDAIEMAAKAIAYQQANPGKPISMVGYSGGGYAAKEAVEILNKAGVQSKGVGIGTPMFGATGQVGNDQFRSYLGEADPLARLAPVLRSPNQRYLQDSGKNHKLSAYLGGKGLQREVQGFLGQKTTGANPADFELQGFEEQLNAMAEDFGAVLGDQSQVQFFQKTGLYKTYIQQIKGHRAKLAALIAEASDQTTQQIEEYDEALVDAENLIKQVFGDREAVVPPIKGMRKADVATRNTPPPSLDTQAAIEAVAPKSVAEKIAEKPAPQQDAQAAKVRQEAEKAIAQSQKEFFDIYTKLIHRSAKAIGIESIRVPEVDQSATPGANGQYASEQNKILISPDKFKRIHESLAKNVADLTQRDLDNIIKETSTIAHESFHAMQSGFSGASGTELLSAGKNYAVDVPVSEEGTKQFQRLKKSSIATQASRSATAFTKNQSFQNLAPEMQAKVEKGVKEWETQAYSFQAEFMAAMAEAAKSGSVTVGDAFEKAIDSTTAVLANAAQSAKANTAQAVQVEPPVAMEAAPMEAARDLEQELNRYTAEVLREIHRVAGLGVTKAKKADIISNLSSNLKPGDLANSIDAVTPMIERGDRGGMKLKKVAPGATDEKILSQVKAIEQKFNAEVARVSALQGKAFNVAMGNLLDQANEQIAEFDAVAKMMIAPETRAEVGRTKGRYEQFYRASKPKLQAGVGASQGATIATLDSISLAKVDTSELTRAGLKAYQAVIRSIAKASNTTVAPTRIPDLIVDDGRLKEMGAKALYDIKNNQIIVDEAIAKILNEGTKTLDEYADQLKSLVHEGRHAAQFKFGEEKLSDVARTGRAHVEMIDPANVPQSAKSNAARSVSVANQQAGGLLGNRQKQAIYRTEADAYAFEQFTPKILANAKQEARGGLRGRLQDISESFGDSRNRAKANVEAISGAIGKIPQLASTASSFVGQLSEDLMSMGKSLVEGMPGGKALGGFIDSLGVAKKLVLPLVAAFAGFQILQQVAGWLNQAATAAIDSSLAMERLSRSFTFAYGSASKGREAIAKVRASAEDLGVNERSALEGSSGLASAAKDTPLEGRTAELGAKALQQAIAVTGIGKEQGDRAYLAVQQIAQKGTVSAEELRGQLGEALQGLPVQQIAARSMGTTVQGFNQQLNTGSITAEQFLPKFFNQLLAETSSGVPDAKRSSQATGARFENRVTNLQQNVGDALMPARNAGLEAMSGAIDLLIRVVPVLAQGIAALSITIGVGLLKNLIAFITKAGVATIATDAWTLSTEFAGKAFGKLSAFMNSSAFSAAGLTVGIFAGIEVFKILQKVLSDSGQKAKDFADQTTKSIAQYRQSMNGARGEKPLDPGLPSSGDTKESATGGTFIGGIVGAENSASAERLIQGNRTIGALIPGLTQLTALAQATGKSKADGSLYTHGDLAAQQQRLGEGEAIAQGGIVQSDIQNLLEQFKGIKGVQGSGGKGVLADLKGINDQLDSVQGQRRALMPGDATGKRSLDLQEQGLLEKQSVVLQPVSEMQSTLAATIEQKKTLIEDAKKRNDAEGVRILNVELQQSIKLQDDFNKALANVDADGFTRLAIEFDKIQSNLNKANRELEKSANAGKRAIASATLGGASAGQTEFMRSANEQSQSKSKIGANEKAIGQINNSLGSMELTKALANVGIKDLSKVTPDDIKSKVANTPTLSSGEKDRLNTAAEQYQKAIDLGSENDGLKTQIEESKAQTTQRLRDLATQVNDFYRGIEQSSKDLILQTQQSKLQSQASDAQSRLKSALVGVQDSFTNDFVQALVGFIDALNKPLQDAIEAQKQALGAKNQYFQQIQQGFQLSQQLPGGFDAAQPPGGAQSPDGAQSEVQVGNGAIAQASATAASPAAGGKGATNPTDQTPQQFLGQLQGVSRMSAGQAQASGAGTLQSAMSTAGENYNSQIANIQRQLEASGRMAQVEQRMQVSQAGYSLFKANRQIQDTGRGFDRSTEDLQSRSQTQTPQKELQSNLRGIGRDFEDQMRSMGDFKRGLDQTITQQMQLRRDILEGVLPPEFKQFLPQINETIANAQQQLGNLSSNMANYQGARDEAVKFAQEEFERMDEQRRFDARKRSGDLTSQLRQAGATSLTLDKRDASGLDYTNKVESQKQNFEGQQRELKELARTGQITGAEFAEMSAKLEKLNSLSLSNLRKELTETKREAAIASRQMEIQDKIGMAGARAQFYTLRDKPQQAAAESAYGKGLEIGSQLASRIKELQDLRKEGKLTERQFATVTENAKGFANLSLQNARDEMRKTANQNLVGALSGSGSDVNRGEISDRLKRNYQVATNAGLIDPQSRDQFREALSQAQYLTRGDSTNSDTAALKALRGSDNPFLKDLVSQFGRGDLVQMAGLPTGGDINSMMKGLNGGFAEGSDQSAIAANTEALVNEATNIGRKMDALIAVSQGRSIPTEIFARKDTPMQERYTQAALQSSPREAPDMNMLLGRPVSSVPIASADSPTNAMGDRLSGAIGQFAAKVDQLTGAMNGGKGNTFNITAGSDMRQLGEFAAGLSQGKVRAAGL